MHTPTKEPETRQEKEETRGKMKHDWLVENDDARKTLHDLYFETGSLPGQQPKVKPKETEKQAELPKQSAPSGTAEVAIPVTFASPAGSEGSWVKRIVYITLALLLAFIAYRKMPNLDVSPTKAAPQHSRSPLIREAMTRRQSQSAPLQPASTVPALGSLAVSPTMILAQFKPGQSITQTLTVDNQTPTPMTFAMEAEDLVIQDGELILVPAGDTPNSVAASAVFSQKFVQVAPMEKATVQVTLTWPASTTVRGVLARLRGTNELPLQGAGTMTASLGAMITLAGSQETPGQIGGTGSESPSSKPRFAISQWSMQRDSTSADTATGPARNSKEVRAAKYAGLGENQ